MKKIIAVTMLSLLLLASYGCGANPKFKTQNEVTQNESQIQFDPELAQKVKESVKQIKGVQDSTAVVVNKDIPVAIKVKGFDRLHLKSIRQDVQKVIKGSNKDYSVYVTSDKKIFAQLLQIEKKITDQEVQSKTDIMARIKKIIKDMQG